MREKNIKDLRDNKVRELAQTLKSSGMAASESEAVRMALDMTGTASKITDNISEKDRRAKNLSVSYVQEKAVETVTDNKGNESTEVLEQEEVQIETQTPTKKQSRDEEVSEDKDILSQGLNQEGTKPKHDSIDFNKVSVAQASGLESMSEEKPSKQPEHTKEQAPQEKKERKKDADVRQTNMTEEERKKKAAQMEESKVNLADTFKFG